MEKKILHDKFHHSCMESSLWNERKILYEEREGNIKKCVKIGKLVVFYFYFFALLLF
jgi:hypothetical protein